MPKPPNSSAFSNNNAPLFKSGFAALIGRPNAGKSTLLNRLLSAKVAIVSEKPQTTRNQVRGIFNDERMQAVFMDTPGVHKPRHKLDEHMMRAVTESVLGCDVALFVVDVSEPYGKGEQYIAARLLQIKAPVLLLLNKIDLVEKTSLLPLLAKWQERFCAAEMIPLSAATGENCQLFLDVLYKYLPEGPRYYPEGVLTDQPEQLLLAELVREQVLAFTGQEIPHAAAVTIAAMEERPDNRLYVEANIYVERESQKGIVIGRQGAMLKKIGTAARQEMERLLACPVYLELRVRTKRDWRNNERLLKSWDIDL
ncbi:MAG: GTPase Era [Clostridiales bacterium]|nr:GTPase Era [Clostridiales bacterium]